MAMEIREEWIDTNPESLESQTPGNQPRSIGVTGSPPNQSTQRYKQTPPPLPSLPLCLLQIWKGGLLLMLTCSHKCWFLIPPMCISGCPLDMAEWESWPQ
jgi:hypothetical protein